MRFALFAPAGLPLLAAWALSSGAPASGWRRGMVAAIDALALLSTVWIWNTDVGADLFSLFLAASVLAALAFAALTPEQEVDFLGRLHLGASASIAAASSSELWWSVAAILLFGILLRQSKERRLVFVVPGVAAVAGLALVLGADSEGIGSILIAAGLSTWWLVVSREVLRGSTSGRVTRMAASFLLLVAVSSVLLRIAAWMPESAVGAIHALAMVALALGALGALGATRITTFLTALALARTGLVLFALLGGVQGRASFLMALAASGVSLLLLAAALDQADAIDDVSNLGSVSRRLVLTLGALSACSFPPFPGFVALFPLASAVLDRSHAFSLLVAAALSFLLAVGSMRVVAHAWDSGRARTVEDGVGLAALGLAIAATILLSIAPAGFVELARAAALSFF